MLASSVTLLLSASIDPSEDDQTERQVIVMAKKKEKHVRLH